MIDHVRRIEHLDFTIIDHGDALSDCHGFDLVMRHINHGLPIHFMEFDQFFSGVASKLRIQIGQWFIKQKEIRLLHDGSGQSDALSLSAGQFSGETFFQTAQVQDIHRIRHTFFDVRFRDPVHTKAIRNILFYGHMRE